MPISGESNIAIVAIGRNEGDRLKLCLKSITGRGHTVVYVDSGSTDGSPDFAASLGCHVVRLDPALPFTAARARNEGFDALIKLAPPGSGKEVDFIQFLDGDCELDPDWLATGIAALNQRPDAAIVCGYVRELRRDASIYNMMCDLEWHQPPGEVLSSGGRFLIRAQVYANVGGFRPDVIAAEDDEFCIRVRSLGFKILQLDANMARHDAAITRFNQWWRRSRRTGHAYAQVASLHGSNAERYFVKDVRKILLYGLILPLIAIALAPFTFGATIFLALALYLLQYLRIYRGCRNRDCTSTEAIIYSAFTVLYKFPAMFGVIEFYWRQRRGHAHTIIEYKRSASRA